MTKTSPEEYLQIQLLANFGINLELKIHFLIRFVLCFFITFLDHWRSLAVSGAIENIIMIIFWKIMDQNFHFDGFLDQFVDQK